MVILQRDVVHGRQHDAGEDEIVDGQVPDLGSFRPSLEAQPVGAAAGTSAADEKPRKILGRVELRMRLALNDDGLRDGRQRGLGRDDGASQRIGFQTGREFEDHDIRAIVGRLDGGAERAFARGGDTDEVIGHLQPVVGQRIDRERMLTHGAATGHETGHDEQA